ncbi:MAG: TonB-dependent receptor [Bacteroidota bacterium]
MLVLSLGIFSGLVRGQDSLGNYRLDTLQIVSELRAPTNFTRSASAVSVLLSPQIEQLSARSTPELLASIPGLWMQKTNHGGGSPFVRGLTGNQSLLMIDGIRLNNSTFRYGPNQYLNTIDPWNIERVEVIRGGGSVQYGSDALGGLVHIISQKPQFSKQGTQFHGQLIGKWMSHDMEKSGRVNIEVQSPRLALRLGASYKDFGDLLAGGDQGFEAPSGYTEYDGDFMARIKLQDRQLLTFAYQGVEQRNVGRYDQVAQRGYEIYEFEPQRRQLMYARWQLDTDRAIFSRLRLTLSQQSSLEGRHKRRENAEIESFEEDKVATRGINLEINSALSPNWQASSGIEMYNDLINSKTSRRSLIDGLQTDQRGLYPDGATALNLAVYSLHKFQFQQWLFSAGLRYNYFRLQAEDEQFGNIDVQPQALVGNTSLQYLWTDQLTLILSYQNGFRAPNINDLSSFGSFDSGIEVPSADLASERSNNVELGIRCQSEKLRFAFYAYHNQLSNLIARVPTTYQGSDSLNGEAVFVKANIDRAYIRGLEAEFGWQFNRSWRVDAFGIYTLGEDEYGSPLRRIPPLHGSVQFRYIRGENWSWVLEWQAAAAQTRLSGGDIKDHRIADGGTAAWQVINMYASYQMRFFRFNIGLQNLTNTLYRTHGSGIDGYGRSIWLSTIFRF